MLVDYKNLISQFADQKYIPIIWIGYIVLWIYSIIRVAKDINMRTNSNLLRFFSLILIWAVWPIWLPIYWLIRPIWYLYQKKISTNTDEVNCGSCDQKNNINNDFCVFCGSGVKVQCKECKILYPSNYQYCCKCWAPNISIK